MSPLDPGDVVCAGFRRVQAGTNNSKVANVSKMADILFLELDCAAPVRLPRGPKVKIRVIPFEDEPFSARGDALCEGPAQVRDGGAFCAVDHFALHQS